MQAVSGGEWSEGVMRDVWASECIEEGERGRGGTECECLKGGEKERTVGGTGALEGRELPSVWAWGRGALRVASRWSCSVRRKCDGFMMF